MKFCDAVRFFSLFLKVYGLILLLFTHGFFYLYIKAPTFTRAIFKAIFSAKKIARI